MSENKVLENKEWQKEELHLKECRSLIAANIEEYSQQYEARRKETKELFDAVQSLSLIHIYEPTRPST